MSVFTRHTARPSIDVRAEVSRAGGCRLDIFPLSVEWVADLLARVSLPYLVVADVSFVAHTDDRRDERSLARFVRSAGVQLLAEDPDGGRVVIWPEDLALLLQFMGHWNLHCWDAPSVPAPKALGRVPAMEGLTLDTLREARFFLDSHDDSYFRMLCRDVRLGWSVIGRAFASLVYQLHAIGDADFPARRTVLPQPGGLRVDDLPRPLAEQLVRDTPRFHARATAAPARPARVRIEYMALPEGDFIVSSEATIDPLGHFEYDLQSRTWRHRYG